MISILLNCGIHRPTISAYFFARFREAAVVAALVAF